VLHPPFPDRVVHNQQNADPSTSLGMTEQWSVTGGRWPVITAEASTSTTADNNIKLDEKKAPINSAP
jgi:hypothetical protein